ncbi:MAG: DUF4345 domain-containing protein [Parasphingorhabdus sp.]|uniref:DUF4345 domain-containing protein n=1 Tax=Parasphingorhabdus sp. TaxID=2709688 RepID=UPI00329710EB
MTVFRIVTIIFGLIPLYFGVVGIVAGAAGLVPEPELYSLPDITALDNQYRYLSGIYIGISAMLFYSAGDIVGRAPLFQMAVLAIFIGGIARVISYLSVGQPPLWQIGGMILELGAPILLFWQAKLLEAQS